MEQFLTTIPGTVAAWVVVITLVIGGVLVVIGLWDKKVKERKKETDGSEDRLIEILQTTVNELEKKVDQQTKDIEGLTKTVEELKRDNEKYIDIFKGRDGQTQQFYKEGFEAMKIANLTHDVVTTMAESVKNTNENLKSTNENINKLIDLLGKHLEVSDHASGK